MKETLGLVQLDYPSHASPTVRKQYHPARKKQQARPIPIPIPT